jgi:hypothetical protein
VKYSRKVECNAGVRLNLRAAFTSRSRSVAVLACDSMIPDRPVSCIIQTPSSGRAESRLTQLLNHLDRHRALALQVMHEPARQQMQPTIGQPRQSSHHPTAARALWKRTEQRPASLLACLPACLHMGCLSACAPALLRGLTSQHICCSQDRHQPAVIEHGGHRPCMAVLREHSRWERRRSLLTSLRAGGGIRS